MINRNQFHWVKKNEEILISNKIEMVSEAEQLMMAAKINGIQQKRRK